MTGLCDYEDIISRMADVSMATASDDESFNAEVIQRKLTQTDVDLTLKLTKKVQKVINPFLTDAYNHTPAQIVELITDEAKAFLKETAIVTTIKNIYEEGVNRLRFPGQEEADNLKKVAKYWSDLAEEEFESVCPLLTFNQDGSSTVTLLERLLMQRTGSVRVTV